MGDYDWLQRQDSNLFCCFLGVVDRLFTTSDIHHIETEGVTGSGLKQNYLARDFAFMEAIEAFVDFFQMKGVSE